MRSISQILTAVAAATAALSMAALPTSAQAAEVNSFRVGIQFADDGGRSQHGVEQFTKYAKFGNSVSPWAGDSNGRDPDAVLIDLQTVPGDLLGKLDFRIGAQAMDGSGGYGTVQYTPWASQGGGDSSYITDDNGYDPDKYRLFLDTRAWPTSANLNDFRLSVQAVDGGRPGVPTVTPWASQGGGKSAWALDDNGYDPDGIVIGLEVQ